MAFKQTGRYVRLFFQLQRRPAAVFDVRAMKTWQPITANKLEDLVTHQLAVCSPEHQKLFEAIRVPFYQVPIHRLGTIEKFFVVAALPNRVLYYEDVEEGFEIQELSDGGEILNQGCSQYELHHVLHQISSNPSFKRDA